MDRGKRPGKMLAVRNNKIYMDLKDIIRENTLPFLPAKSLFRFRSVCRDWKLQISSPFFSHNQSLSSRAVSGFFYQAPGEPPSLAAVDPRVCGVPDPTLRFLPEPVDIRSSSNGLLCCQGQAGDRAYYICNPVTQQFKKLPKPNADHGRHPAVVLVFEPSLLNFEAEYKVISAFASNDFDDATEFEIYSSKEGSWRISREICFTDLRIDPKTGVYVNGVVFWKGRSILGYDLTKERCQLFHYYNHQGTLGTIQERLCYASSSGRSVLVSVVWNLHSNTMQMSSQANLWKEKEQFMLDSTIGGTGADQDVLAISGGLLLVKSGGKLFSYDLKTKKLTDLNASADQGNAVYMPYVNSFASL